MSLPTSSDLAQFLSALWPDLEGSGRWLLFWGAPSKRSEWVQAITPDTLAMLEAWAAKENVYVGCALRSANLGPTLRGEKAECTGIPGVWMDIDYGAEHKKPNLPPTEEEAMELIRAMGPAPSVLIHSGRGLQAWWLFREPWALDRDADRDEAEALTKGWCNTLRAKAKAKGWDADQVGDLPRVMRLPGLWNRKGVPLKTKLLSLTEDRYNPTDLLPYLQIGAETQETLPNLTWTFDLSPTAEPPADKFMLLSEIDLQFKLAWIHGRKDLQDQSASSYDLSLATRALAAQWTAQETVNLLIAHRRKHKEDLKLRKDYYERTLSRAMSGKGEEARKQLVDDLKAGKPLPESVTKDPAEVLALLSSVLEVQITKLIRYRGETNTYQMDVNGRTINVPGIEDFDSQTRFRRLLLDHTDVRIPNFKPDKWHEILQRLFMAVENVDVVSGTNRGAYENWLEMYLSEGVEPEEMWQKAAIEYRPFCIKKETYIVAEGFRRFLTSQMNERLTSQELTIQLTKLGYQYERKNVRNQKGKSTKRSVWRIH